MSRIEAAVERFRAGCNCSQAILSTYGESLGVDAATALRIACGFGGGMRLAETCGAVTGAIMVIGLRHGPVECADRAAKGETYRQTAEFSGRYRARHGSVSCRNLLGCDISTPEGLRQAQEQNLFTTRCPELVREAALLLEEML